MKAEITYRPDKQTTGMKIVNKIIRRIKYGKRYTEDSDDSNEGDKE